MRDKVEAYNLICHITPLSNITVKEYLFDKHLILESINAIHVHDLHKEKLTFSSSRWTGKLLNIPLPHNHQATDNGNNR